MNPGQPHRPILVVLTSHWIAMAGVALVTLAGFSWVFLLPANVGGHVGNPYIGLLIFFAVPMVFFAGLALIPVGIVLGRRKLTASLDLEGDRKSAWRRAGIFFGVMTVVNLIIASQVSYRAVEHMETVQFCGQTCHVMQPEFTAHLQPKHQEVTCGSCHIAPGATGWLRAKMAGTNQLISVILNNYPRPIESAMENNKLVSSADTCEQCHARGLMIGPRLRMITKYKDDEANTRSETVLTMLVGGGRFGGIHGAHMGPGVHIRYAAADKKRQTIPWVEYTNLETRANRIYVSVDTKPADAKPIDALAKFDMQCVDCHNRAAHSFELPDQAVDKAMASGAISVGLPFVKKTGVDLLKATYASADDAAQKLPAALKAFYSQKYPAIAATRESDIQAAGQALIAIYRNNVFPDLKVTWGTYPNHLGHMDDPGCFRCHDDSHATPDKKTITQDCSACHQSVAMEEAAPEVLKTLGVADWTSKFQKP
jgi:hypothetical protein